MAVKAYFFMRSNLTKNNTNLAGLEKWATHLTYVKFIKRKKNVDFVADPIGFFECVGKMQKLNTDFQVIVVEGILINKS